MPKPYDAASKALIEACPVAWIRIAGFDPQGSVHVANIDLSAVTSAADYVIQVDDDREPWLAHVEFVSNRQHGLPKDLALRNVLLHKRSGLPVQTILILLDPQASQPDLSGVYETRIQGRRQLLLEYAVVKIYEFSVEELLLQPPALAPLAVLSREIKTRDDVSSTLDRLHDRLIEGLADDPGLIKELWTTAEIYLGLKFKGEENKTWIKALTRGVLSVKDSIIYQDILDEGRNEGQARGQARMLLRLGTKRWGQPNDGEKVALEAIVDFERLDRMADQLDQVSSWDQLLQVK